MSNTQPIAIPMPSNAKKTTSLNGIRKEQSSIIIRYNPQCSYWHNE